MNMKPPRLESVRFFKLHLYPFFFSFKPCRNGAAVLPPKPQKGLALHGSFVYIYSVNAPLRRPLLHDPHVFLHNSHSDSVRDPGGRLPSGAAGPGRPVLQALQAAVRAQPGAGGSLSRRSALPSGALPPCFRKKSRPGHRDGVRKTENPPYDLDHTEDYFCAFIPLTCWRRMEIRRKHSTLCRRV